MFLSVNELITAAQKAGASDIHLVCGLTPKFRIDGVLRTLGGEKLTDEVCRAYARDLASDDYEKLNEVGELDLARTVGAVRVRVNIFRQQNHYSVAIRLLSDVIPELASLGLPPIVNDFPTWQRGIVIVTGETGSGKSTTLAAMLEEINRTRTDHIITLEDPIEYIYQPKNCVINQREIGRDTLSYAAGLRASLREDPDVILIGEMRDLETIETALTAAETGHLVFATLHTNSAADSIDRMVDVFPASRQQQIRMQLSQTLKAVMAQQLLPRRGGKGRVCACEVMIVNSAIKNLIREGKTPQISNALATSAQEGSVTMDNMLIKMTRERKIDAETARSAAHDADYVRKNAI